MSRASKLTLLGTSLLAAGTVALVHLQQNWERNTMHDGVVRDMEQQRLKRERQADFDIQREMEEMYLKDQSVHDSTKDTLQAAGGSNIGKGV